jgi:hypothetical protein
MHPHIVVGRRLVCVEASAFVKDDILKVNIVVERDRADKCFDLQFDRAILLISLRII